MILIVPRELYILDCTGRKPIVRQRFDATGMNRRQVHLLEQRIRREHPEIDDTQVFLRDSDNDIPK